MQGAHLAAVVAIAVGFVSSDAVASFTKAPVQEKPEMRASCTDALGQAREAIERGDLAPDKANALFDVVRHASEDASCAVSFAELIDSSECKGNAINAVAAGAFASPAFDGSKMSAIALHAVIAAEQGHSKCARSILPAMQQAANFDQGSRAALTRAAHSTDESLAEAGWLILGTAETIAREHDAMLAASIDAEIAAGLANAKDSDRKVMLLEAAGNGACHSCAADITKASNDPDPWVRRAAASAWRFAPRGAKIMCASLEDKSAAVREHAAWALGLSTNEADIRVACLERATLSDPSEEVRRAASQSLSAQRRAQNPVSEER
jgi:hypothetical protein